MDLEGDNDDGDDDDDGMDIGSPIPAAGKDMLDPSTPPNDDDNDDDNDNEEDDDDDDDGDDEVDLDDESRKSPSTPTETKSVSNDSLASPANEIPNIKKKKKFPPTAEGKQSKKPKKSTLEKKKDKKDKKKKKKKDKDTSASVAAGMPETPTTETEEEDPFAGLFSSVSTGIVQATPAFYFFLAENRLKIERSLIRKHRYFNRLPKGMERNELIAKEGAHWWIKLPPAEIDRFISMSMKDFEKRVIEWKEEKNIQQMTADIDTIDDVPDSTDNQDEKLTYDNHRRLYLGTAVGAKPFKPDLEESNNRVLLELLQDMRFHPMPMLQANRSGQDYGEMDFERVTIPYFDVHGPVSTSLGDECLGCARGWAHLCNVLKRRVPAVEHRAKLQPPLSSLMATRVGLGFQPVNEATEEPSATTEKNGKDVPLFSAREIPAIKMAKRLPAISFEPLHSPSERADDIVQFVEEAVSMKVPEPPRPRDPSKVNVQETKKATITSRAALPIRKKRSADEMTQDDVDGVNVVNKCGRCRTVIDGDTGCVQCRRAQLVINTSREETAKSESKLLQVHTHMLGRVVMKDNIGEIQTEGDEAVANHILRQRWTPFAVLPPQTIHAPDPTLPKQKDDDDDKSITEEEDDAEEESEEEQDENIDDDKQSDVEMSGVVDESLTSSITSDNINPGVYDKESEAAGSNKPVRTSARIVAQEIQSQEQEGEYSVLDLNIEQKDRQLLARRNREEAAELNKKCVSVACCGILLAMMRRDPLLLFAEPVQAEGYDKIIKNPIWFGKMKKEILANNYTFASFVHDAQLLCDNAMIYNPHDSIYYKTAKELYDLLIVMHERAVDWMSAIKEAHSTAWKTADKAKLLARINEEQTPHSSDPSPSSSSASTTPLPSSYATSGRFLVDDPFASLRKSWPEAIDMLRNHEYFRKSLDLDFLRTKENETAYYGSLAVRRAATAAAYSLAPYPDSAGIYNLVGRRTHIEDDNLRNHVADKVVQAVEPPQLKDIPTWREEMIMRVLRKSQGRRTDGMIGSVNGCARCDGMRVDTELKKAMNAENIRWGRTRRKPNQIPRVDSSRLSLSTGLGSHNTQQLIAKRKEEQDEFKKQQQRQQQQQQQQQQESGQRRDGNNKKSSSVKSATSNNTIKALVHAANQANEVAVTVRGSRIHGMGLFADQPFKKGDVVAEYIGEYVTSAVTDAREKVYREERIQDYQFRIDSQLVIDATKLGGHGRYINHSCDPNCSAKIVPYAVNENEKGGDGDGDDRNVVETDGEIKKLKRVVIVAMRDIEPMEEFSYDYQFPLELDLSSRIPCNCHSEACRGFMNWDLPEKGANQQDFRTQKRGANMRDRIRRLGRPLKGDK
jgi:histone-lysine N-methyltransferase SETD1